MHCFYEQFPGAAVIRRKKRIVVRPRDVTSECGANSSAANKGVAARTCNSDCTDIAVTWVVGTLPWHICILLNRRASSTETWEVVRDSMPPSPKVWLVTAIPKLKSLWDQHSRILKELAKVPSSKHSDVAAVIGAVSVPEYRHAPPTQVDMERSFFTNRYLLKGDKTSTVQH